MFDLPTIHSGVRADPLHGICLTGGAEGISQYASIHLPGMLRKLDKLYVVRALWSVGGVPLFRV